MVDTANPRKRRAEGGPGGTDPNIPILLAGLITIAAADVSAADQFVGRCCCWRLPSSA
jgi:hypothetical protein